MGLLEVDGVLVILLSHIRWALEVYLYGEILRGTLDLT